MMKTNTVSVVLVENLGPGNSSTRGVGDQHK